MKKLFFFGVSLLLLCSCKGYVAFNPAPDQAYLSPKICDSLVSVDLSGYELYVRQIARPAPPASYLARKGGDRFTYSQDRFNIEDRPLLHRDEIERLEIQYLLISPATGRVILISTIPPFSQNDTGGFQWPWHTHNSKMIYNYALFDNDSIVNIDYFNYFKFGTIENGKFFFDDDHGMHADYTTTGTPTATYIDVTGLDYDAKFSSLNNSLPFTTRYYRKPLWDFRFHQNVAPESQQRCYYSSGDIQTGYNWFEERKLADEKMLYYYPKKDLVCFELQYYYGLRQWIYFRNRVKTKYR